MLSISVGCQTVTMRGRESGLSRMSGTTLAIWLITSRLGACQRAIALCKAGPSSLVSLSAHLFLMGTLCSSARNRSNSWTIDLKGSGWVVTSLKDKLIKIGAKVASHGRYVVFQMAEVAIPRQMFQEILRLIAELRPQPPPASA